MLVAVELQVVEATAFCLIGKGLNPGGTRVQILAFRLISDVVNLDGLFLSNSVKPSAFLSRKNNTCIALNLKIGPFKNHYMMNKTLTN